MIRAWAPVVLALVLAGFAGGLAPASAAGAPAGPVLAAAPSAPGADRGDCCPDGCTDCPRPCCQAPGLACLAPAPVFAAVPSAIPAPLPIDSQHTSAPLRALDRPPRS